MSLDFPTSWDAASLSGMASRTAVRHRLTAHDVCIIGQLGFVRDGVTLYVRLMCGGKVVGA